MIYLNMPMYQWFCEYMVDNDRQSQYIADSVVYGSTDKHLLQCSASRDKYPKLL